MRSPKKKKAKKTDRAGAAEPERVRLPRLFGNMAFSAATAGERFLENDDSEEAGAADRGA